MVVKTKSNCRRNRRNLHRIDMRIELTAPSRHQPPLMRVPSVASVGPSVAAAPLRMRRVSVQALRLHGMHLREVGLNVLAILLIFHGVVFNFVFVISLSISIVFSNFNWPGN